MSDEGVCESDNNNENDLDSASVSSCSAITSNDSGIIPLKSTQIQRLSKFMIHMFDGEPSKSVTTVDTHIVQPYFLTFKSNITQRRFYRFLLSQASWKKTIILITIPSTVLLSTFCFISTGDFLSNEANSTIAYALLIISYAFALVLNFLYLYVLKSFNDKFPFQKLFEAEAANLAFLRSRKLTYSSKIIHKNDDDSEMSFIDQIYEDDLANRANNHVEAIDLVDEKVNQILWVSFLVGLSTIIASNAYGAHHQYHIMNGCVYYCIDNKIASMPLFINAMLPFILTLGLEISWKSVFICEFVSRGGICLSCVYLSGEYHNTLLFNPGFVMIAIGFFFLSIVLQWSLFNRYVRYFYFSDRLSKASVNEERQFLSSHATRLISPVNQEEREHSSGNVYEDTN